MPQNKNRFKNPKLNRTLPKNRSEPKPQASGDKPVRDKNRFGQRLLRENAVEPASREFPPKKRYKEERPLTYDEAQARFADIFHNHDFIEPTNELLPKLTKYFFLLMEEQTKHNSTRLRTLKDVAIKHYIDCLIVAQKVELTFPLLDIGTGPGFPGVPLKLLYPKEQIILAEGVQKRVEFLKKVRYVLKLEKLDIIGRQVNEEFFYPVKAAITRAFADVSLTMSQVDNSLQKGGKLYLMKGPNVDPEIKDAESKWGHKYKLINDVSYTLPKTPHDRRILVYERY